MLETRRVKPMPISSNPNRYGRSMNQPDKPQPGLNEPVDHRIRAGMTVRTTTGKAIVERSARVFKCLSAMIFSLFARHFVQRLDRFPIPGRGDHAQLFLEKSIR